MNITQTILFELVKLYLHPSYSINIPSDIDWQLVYKEAERQNIIAVTWYSIKKLQEEGKFLIDGNEQKHLLVMRWYGMTNLNHKRFEDYQKTIMHLAQFFSSHDLRMMLMKGYGCSLNYPHPESRPCGDVDIWMFGKQKDADQIVRRELNLEVKDSNDHHSVFQFEEFTVENHGSIQDVNIHKSDIYVNNILEHSATEDAIETMIEDVKVLLPSVKFNSIHLLRHMACDFATFTTSLRHLLDWSTFVSNHYTEIDWDYVHKIAHNANMDKFLDAINGICVEYLGYPSQMFPIEKEDKGLRDRVLEDILNNHDTPELPKFNLSLVQKIQYGLFKTSRLIKNRWKYRIVYNESLFESFFTLANHRLKHL